MLNTVFMHADVRARPYRVEDFRDALANLKLLPEVSSLGAYQMNHVWAVTFKGAEGAKRLLESGEVKVKSHRCVLIDPTNQDMRLKLHWLLPTVPDDDVRAALLAYGRATDVIKERWRVSGVSDKGSTTRTVTLKLKPGVKPEDIPHQLRIAGELALVVVPGRAPLCLRCQCTGHIRRDCKVPRCALCRRFGHDESQCVRSYASVAGPMGSDDNSELLMDEADSEAAASAEADCAATVKVPAEQVSVDRAREGLPTLAVEVVPAATEDSSTTVMVRDENSNTASAAAGKDVEEAMDTSKEGVASTKRAHEVAQGEGASADPTVTGEPPSKAAPVRRPTLRPRPTIPQDRRSTAASPPPKPPAT